MSPDAPVLVTGAAGKTGRAVTAAATAAGVPVRALVHREAQRTAATAAGAVDVVVGDQRDEEVVAAAARGARAVYAIAPNMSPAEQVMGQALIAGCRRAGVGRVVYHSVIHPYARAMPHHADKLAVEEALLESGLVPTVLRPNAYFENVLGHVDAMAADGVYEVPYSVVTRHAMVALGDVAAVAARVLTERGHEHAAYELSGPEGLTAAEVAVACGLALGRSVVARPCPAEVWLDARAVAGETRSRLGAMFAHYDAHGSPGNPTVITCLLGRSPTSFADWATAAVAATSR